MEGLRDKGRMSPLSLVGCLPEPHVGTSGKGKETPAERDKAKGAATDRWPSHLLLV